MIGLNQKDRVMKIKFDRWPWNYYNKKAKQRYGWRPRKTILMGRFGGGWNFKLGLMIGSGSIIIDLIFGSIRINWKG